MHAIRAFWQIGRQAEEALAWQPGSTTSLCWTWWVKWFSSVLPKFQKKLKLKLSGCSVESSTGSHPPYIAKVAEIHKRDFHYLPMTDHQTTHVSENRLKAAGCLSGGRGHYLTPAKTPVISMGLLRSMPTILLSQNWTASHWALQEGQ